MQAIKEVHSHRLGSHVLCHSPLDPEAGSEVAQGIVRGSRLPELYEA